MINWDGVDRAITFVTYMAIAFNVFVVIAAMSLLAMMQDHESKGGGK